MYPGGTDLSEVVVSLVGVVGNLGAVAVTVPKFAVGLLVLAFPETSGLTIVAGGSFDAVVIISPKLFGILDGI